MKAVQIDKHGGPKVLRICQLPAPKSASGEVLIKQKAVGVNFMDTYHPSGLYPV